MHVLYLEAKYLREERSSFKVGYRRGVSTFYQHYRELHAKNYFQMKRLAHHSMRLLILSIEIGENKQLKRRMEIQVQLLITL